MANKNGQLNESATKGDVQEAVDELAQITEKNFRRSDERMDRVERIVKTVLTIVKGIDRDNKEFKNHNLPERMAKVEDDVLKLKAKVY